MQLNNAKQVQLADAVAPFSRIRESTASAYDYSRGMKEFEITWVPPLSIFKIDHALPCGRYEMILNPQTSSQYQIQAIESTGANKVPDVDFSFSVQQLYLYIHTMEAARVDNLSYYLDLEQTNCQTEKIDVPAFGQIFFDISPSTYALTVAYQDLRAGSDTRISPTKFVIYNLNGTAYGTELGLNRMFINYSGLNQPQPDADPSYVPTTNTD